MIGRRGLGEYPGYYCYDASRPSWLPYWIDDFTESQCKWNLGNIAGNIKACVTGDPSCNAPPPSAQNPTVSGCGVDPSQCPQSSNPFQTFNPITGQFEFDLTSNKSLLWIGIGLLALFLLKR